MSTEVLQQGVLIVHLLLALAITGLIMLQQGKGAEMGASFGAGASQTLFGSSGSGNVLTRATAWLVALFFATSFGLAVLAKQNTQGQDALGALPPAIESVVEAEAAERAQADAIDQLGDLPAVDNAEPAMSSGDLPVEGDLPELPQ